MIRRYSVILFPLVVLVALGSLACVPPYQPKNAEDIARLNSKAHAAELCPGILARADDVNQSGFDEKTSRHFHEICDCYGRAMNANQEATCRPMLKSASAYEGGKR